jgi:putative transposase
MQTSLVKDALAMAWWRRQPQPGLIFHSDRGSQYCSHDFQDALKGWGVRSSMSRKGNCWDNAPTESFWGRLKTASLYGKKFATREQAMDAVMDWMAFYNHRRLHSTLGYLSPMQFEQRWYMRHSVKKPRKSRAKSYTKQGQGQEAKTFLELR